MSQSEASAAVAASDTGSTTAAANSPTGPTGTAGGDYTNSTSVGSMSDLKDKAPKVYNAMVQGIAQHICSEMKKHQDRLKALMDEGRRNG